MLLVLDDLMEIVARLAPKTEANTLISQRVSRLKGAVGRARARLAAEPAAPEQLVTADIARQRSRVARLEDQLLDAEREAYRADSYDRNGPHARFKAAKLRAQSTETAERHLGRDVFAAQLRQLVEGVVLHENRTITVHTKPDVFGCQIVCALNRDGLQGIQMCAPGGRKGFVGASVFRGVMRSVRPRRRGQDGGTDKPLWQSVDMEGLLRRIHVIHLPNGDWQATVNEDTPIDEIIRRGEHALTFRSTLLRRRPSTRSIEQD